MTGKAEVTGWANVISGLHTNPLVELHACWARSLDERQIQVADSLVDLLRALEADSGAVHARVLESEPDRLHTIVVPSASGNERHECDRKQQDYEGNDRPDGQVEVVRTGRQKRT